jgi:hypothetical protein
MEDILQNAREYLILVHLRMDAHYGSSEWHRARGVRWGVIATLLSAIVSSALFAALTKQVGINGQLAILVPTSGWGWSITLLIGALLVLSPALTGVTTYLNDPDQAQRHNTSAAKYFGVKQRLDLFILRYAKPPTADRRDEALGKLQTILDDIEVIARESITLTPDAIRDARLRLGLPVPGDKPNNKD